MATSLSGPTLVNGPDVFSSNATQYQPLGTVAQTGDGRYYRYALAGGTSTVVGNLLQSPVQQASNVQQTPTAAAINATSLTIPSLSTTVTANQYAGGFLVVAADSGSGGIKQTNYLISSHPAATGGNSCTFTLADPLAVLVTASAKIDLVLPAYNGVIVCPTVLTGIPVGVAISVITNAQYGWIQVAGESAVLYDAQSAPTVGQALMASSSVAGAVRLATAGNTVVGMTGNGVTASSNGSIFLQLL